MSSAFTPSANRHKNKSTISDQIVIHPAALNSYSIDLVRVVPLKSTSKDNTALNSINRPKM